MATAALAAEKNDGASLLASPIVFCCVRLGTGLKHVRIHSLRGQPQELLPK
jgi:hypothetical protein